MYSDREVAVLRLSCFIFAFFSIGFSTLDASAMSRARTSLDASAEARTEIQGLVQWYADRLRDTESPSALSKRRVAESVERLRKLFPEIPVSTTFELLEWSSKFFRAHTTYDGLLGSYIVKGIVNATSGLDLYQDERQVIDFWFRRSIAVYQRKYRSGDTTYYVSDGLNTPLVAGSGKVPRNGRPHAVKIVGSAEAVTVNNIGISYPGLEETEEALDRLVARAALEKGATLVSGEIVSTLEEDVNIVAKRLKHADYDEIGNTFGYIVRHLQVRPKWTPGSVMEQLMAGIQKALFNRAVHARDADAIVVMLTLLGAKPGKKLESTATKLLTSAWWGGSRKSGPAYVDGIKKRGSPSFTSKTNEILDLVPYTLLKGAARPSDVLTREDLRQKIRAKISQALNQGMEELELKGAKEFDLDFTGEEAYIDEFVGRYFGLGTEAIRYNPSQLDRILQIEVVDRLVRVIDSIWDFLKERPIWDQPSIDISLRRCDTLLKPEWHFGDLPTNN